MTDQVVFDYSQSRAVLVGTWDYVELEPIPAARNSLERMVDLLTSSLCGWPHGALSVLANQHLPGDIPDQITGMFETATDVALFYYVGHGLQDPDDELCLGLVNSRVSPTRRATTSLRFDDVRRALRHSEARTKIVILDCCFAGLARPDGSLASQPDIAELAGRAGAFTMAASGFYTAWFEREGDKPQTYFTKSLVDIIERGLPNEPAGLKLNPIFKQLSMDLARAGKPRPTRWNSDLADQYVFARNAAHSLGMTSTAAAKSLWMAPPYDRMVERPELGSRLIAALTEWNPTEAAPSIGLLGAGGFGKTHLATWACHQREIARGYPGGLLWVTLGHDEHGANQAERINNLVYALCGRRPAISDPEIAGWELGRLLDERESVLLVIDDVWKKSQLRPFLLGGKSCARLVTTRISGLLSDEECIRVDAMSDVQARELMCDRVAGLPVNTADQLAVSAGRWPVLLNLVNGVLRRRIAQGQPSQQAAVEILHQLTAEGPTVFDPIRPEDRSQAVAATVHASMAFLSEADRDRFIDLAIFPQDVGIPFNALELLWPRNRVDALCQELVTLGLAVDWRWNASGQRLILHDVIRSYLRMCNGIKTRANAHQRLISAAAELLHEHDGTIPWWTLPSDRDYLWRYLAQHMHEAGLDDQAGALMCDLRWVEAKIRKFGSVTQVLADLSLVDNPTIELLRQILQQAECLLGPIDPPAALGATLASRLYAVPELQSLLERYSAVLPRPLLEPVWPLADRTDLIGTATAPGHIGGVTDCAFSPDGDLLASAGEDGTVRLWRVIDGVEQRVLRGHLGGVTDCAFSPDGDLLASAGEDGTVRLWRVIDGVEQRTLRGHAGGIRGCVFSPDGDLLASAGEDGTVRLWRVIDGVEQRTLRGHAGGIRGCVFSPDGDLLASAGEDGTVRLWRVIDGVEQRTLRGHAGGIRGCVFSPDGDLLASAGQDGTVQLWRLANQEYEVLPTASADKVLSCAFSPDGALLATTSYGTVRLWNVRTRVEQAAITGHVSAIWACAFSPDGLLLATASIDQTLRLWHVADGTEHAVLTRHTYRMDACAFSPDGALLATAAVDGAARIWRVPDGTEFAVLRGHASKLSSCAFSPDGALLATASNDRTVRLWRVTDSAVQVVLDGHLDWVRSCAFSPDGKLLATASADGTARLWHVADGALAAVLNGHTGRVYTCSFSPDGTLLATAGTDRTVRLWHVGSGNQRAVLNNHTDLINSCAFSPDGTLLATASDDRTARLWQVCDGVERTVLRGHTGWVDDCRFSPNGVLLATASGDGTIRVWQVTTGRCLCALRFAAPVIALAWHPDGRMLGVASGAGVNLLAYRS